MRELLDRAVAQRRLALLWVPPMRGQTPAPVPVAFQPKPKVALTLPIGINQPQLRPPVKTLSIAEKFEAALELALGYIVKDAKASAAGLVRSIRELTPEKTALLLGSLALIAVPGAGEVMLAYVCFRLGFDGARAAIQLTHSCYAVATAQNERDLDTAARELANGIEALGETLLDWVMKGQLMKAAASEAAAAEGAGTAAKAESETAAKVAPKAEGRSYKEFLSKKDPEKADAIAVAESAGRRVFTSDDPLVADLANEIEEAYPGHVIGVNIPIRDAEGRLVTDADIQLKNCIIQVKSGGGKGLAAQIERTQDATGIITIGYGPDLKPTIIKAINNAGNLVTTDKGLLIEVIKP